MKLFNSLFIAGGLLAFASSSVCAQEAPVKKAEVKKEEVKKAEVKKEEVKKEEVAAICPKSKALLEESAKKLDPKNLAKNAKTSERVLTFVSPFQGSITILVDGKDKISQTSKINFMGQSIESALVINGDKGWQSAPGQMKELPPEQIKLLKGSISRSFGVVEVDTLKSLKQVKDAKVDGKDCFVLESVTKADEVTTTLYIEKDTKFLVKMDAKAPNGGTVATLLSGYKDFGGYWSPTSIKTTGGQMPTEIRIDKFEINKPIDASKFNKPAPIAAPAGMPGMQMQEPTEDDIEF